MREMEQLISRLVSEKATGIGGSDIGDVLSLEPWGCRRRLYYEKTNTPPDYEEEVNPLLERGIALEAIALEMYERKTDRRTSFNVPGRQTLSPTRLYRHPENEALLVHLDAVVWREKKGRGRPRKTKGDEPTAAGVLEIKTVGERMFWKIKKEGLPDAYIMQVQHAMNVTGLNWASFGILWPDGWRILTFDVAAKKNLQAAAAEESLKFLAELKQGTIPERLSPKDKRCSRCAWRSSCQGAALLEAAEGEFDHSNDAELQAIVSRYWDLKGMRDEAEELYEGVKDEIRLRLGDCQRVEIRGSRIYNAPVVSNRIDVTRLRKLHPKITEECSTVSVSKPLRVYAI